MFTKTGAAGAIKAFGAAATAAMMWRLLRGGAQPWVWAFLLPASLGVAILRHALIAQYTTPVRRYLARHQTLAGPREGAELPG